MYEHVFLARQDVSAPQAGTLQEEFAKVIADQGGQVGKTEYWGLKPLAYKIKKNRKAHFTLMNIDAPPEALAEMERQMRLSGDVIRFLTLRVEELDDKPSPMMKRSDDRRPSRRGGRSDGDRRDERGSRSGGQE
jgi:small subunit ribosomal protein S6